MCTKINYKELLLINIERDGSEEFEVSTNAVNIYKTYPVYESDIWKISNEREKCNSRGKCLVAKERKMFIAADMLTSIRTPINKILESNNKKKTTYKGLEIVEHIEELEIDEDLIPFIKTFLKVYYTAGNMIPIIEGGQMSGSNDTAEYKLLVIKEMFAKKSKYVEKNELTDDKIIQYMCEEYKKDAIKLEEEKLWGRIGYIRAWIYWIIKEWKNQSYDEFVNKCMLHDCVKVYKNYPIQYDVKEWKEWFVIHTKMIIQRSFRIYANIYKDNTVIDFETGEITAYGKDQLKSIFKEVFKECKGYDCEIL